MFLPKWVFEKFAHSYDAFLTSSRSHTELSLTRVINAKNSEVSSVLAAKEAQVKFLSDQAEKLQKQVEHERLRAEAAIDRLLAQQRIYPVSAADLERQAQEKAANEPPLPPEKKKTVDDIMAQVNSVLDDVGKEDPMERIATIGGLAVE
jgi:SpoVK/Ycf46/Vps4 family AAA+-type ATPase